MEESHGVLLFWSKLLNYRLDRRRPPSHHVQVEAFILEGVSSSGADKRTLNLPTSDKITRTKVLVVLIAVLC